MNKNKEMWNDWLIDNCVVNRKSFGVFCVSNEPFVCSKSPSMDCKACLFCDLDSCVNGRKEWLESEYMKPCPFKKGEIVEVRDFDTEDWVLSRFSHMDEDGNYVCFEDRSKIHILVWKQCRIPEPYSEGEEEEKEEQEEDEDYDNSVIQCTKCPNYKFIGHGLYGCDFGGDYCPYEKEEEEENETD